MAEEKETFILRTEWYEAIQELDEKSKAELLDNLFLFHLNEETKINLNNLSVKLVWKLIEPNLKRNIESYDKRKSTSSENGKKGGRPPKNQPIEGNVKNLNNLKKPNESLSVSVTVSDSDNNFLLEKETKNACEEISNFSFSESGKNPEEEKKEKSCAKKEKDLEELKESEFFEKVCDYFSQTTERQRMNVFGEMVRIYDQNEIEEFQKQTNAYMEYKPLADEKPHSWMNYPSQWKNQNWIDKLQKLKSKNGKSNNQAGRAGVGNISGRAKVIASGNITEFT